LCSCFFLLLICIRPLSIFFFIYPVPSHIYTLSLHDALPISFGEGLFSCRCCERDRFSNINCCKNGTWYSKSYLVNGKSGPKYGIGYCRHYLERGGRRTGDSRTNESCINRRDDKYSCVSCMTKIYNI